MLHDLITCDDIYETRFRGPLYELSGQLLGRKDARLNESVFDRRVADVVREIEEGKPPAQHDWHHQSELDADLGQEPSE